MHVNCHRTSFVTIVLSLAHRTFAPNKKPYSRARLDVKARLHVMLAGYTGITTTGFPLEVHRRELETLAVVFLPGNLLRNIRGKSWPVTTSGGRSPLRYTRLACGESRTRVNDLFVSLLRMPRFIFRVTWKSKVSWITGVTRLHYKIHIIII